MTPIQRATRAAEGYLMLHMPDEAWQELEDLEPDDRANPDVLALRVRVFLLKDMLPSAVITAQGLVRVVPWSMPARELAAQVLERWGRFDAALAMFEGAPPEAKKDAVHYLHEGRLLIRVGRRKEGCDRLTQAVEMDRAIQTRILADEHLEDIWWLTPRKE